MNKKIIGFAAVCGFVLSFLTGVIAKNPVLAIFLRSLIFAAVFSVLSFAISFLFSKFLADDSKGVYLNLILLKILRSLSNRKTVTM